MDISAALSAISLIVVVEGAIIGWMMRHAGRITAAETWIRSMRERDDQIAYQVAALEVKLGAKLDRIEDKLDSKANKSQFGEFHG